MDGTILLLLAALVQSPPVSAAPPPIDFYFTNEAILERGAAGAEQWASQSVGEFAQVAAGYAPDARMSADERKMQSAKFDRREFERLATDAWRKAHAALPQGPLRVCIDLATPADAFTRDVMGGVVGVTAGRARCSRTPRPGSPRSMPHPTTQHGARSRSS